MQRIKLNCLRRKSCHKWWLIINNCRNRTSRLLRGRSLRYFGSRTAAKKTIRRWRPFLVQREGSTRSHTRAVHIREVRRGNRIRASTELHLGTNGIRTGTCLDRLVSSRCQPLLPTPSIRLTGIPSQKWKCLSLCGSSNQQVVTRRFFQESMSALSMTWKSHWTNAMPRLFVSTCTWETNKSSSASIRVRTPDASRACFNSCTRIRTRKREALRNFRTKTLQRLMNKWFHRATIFWQILRPATECKTPHGLPPGHYRSQTSNHRHQRSKHVKSKLKLS